MKAQEHFKYSPTPVRCHGCGKVLNPEVWLKTLKDGKAYCRKCYNIVQSYCEIPCHECPDYPCWSVTT